MKAGEYRLPVLLTQAPAHAILDGARCSPETAEVFDDPTDDYAAARWLCQQCEVAHRCQDWAVHAGEKHLAAGGLSPDQLKEARRQLKQRRSQFTSRSTHQDDDASPTTSTGSLTDR